MPLLIPDSFSRRPQPPRPPEFFGGRSEELKHLKERLIQGNAAKVVLTASGGLGKTTLVRKAAHDLYAENQFQGVVWLEVKPHPNLEGLLLKLAGLIQHDFKMDKYSIDQLIVAVKDGLEALIIEKCDAGRLLVGKCAR